MTQAAPQNGVPQTARGRLELVAKNLVHVVSKELTEEQCAMLERSPVLPLLDRSIGFLRKVQSVEGALREMTVMEFIQLTLRVVGVGNVSADMTVLDALKLLQGLAQRARG